jgi:DNA-binding transcriptional MocR family regulator
MIRFRLESYRRAGFNLALDDRLRPLANSGTMQITPFRIEEYMGKYEFSAKYLLSSSDAESQTIGDLLSLESGAHDAFLKHWCGYTESPGAPYLREALATVYQQIHPDQIVVAAAAEEAIFLFYQALLTPSDHVVVETPCYESALTVPKSTGATVTEWRRKPEDGWAHDDARLERLIRPNTRAIYINTPHNPTGLLMQPRPKRLSFSSIRRC